jgi:hypothetical protein
VLKMDAMMIRVHGVWDFRSSFASPSSSWFILPTVSEQPSGGREDLMLTSRAGLRLGRCRENEYFSLRGHYSLSKNLANNPFRINLDLAPVLGTSDHGNGRGQLLSRNLIRRS